MNATALAVGLCLASAVAYAAAAVAQERLARAGAARSAKALLGNGAWWWSAGLNAAAALLHAAALRYGPLTLVQPLGALTLVAAVPLGAHGSGRRVAATEWRGTLATVAGLGLLLLPASGPAPDDTLTLAEALAVSGATAAVILLLTAAKDPRSGLRHATASGLASAAASALTQTVAVAGGAADPCSASGSSPWPCSSWCSPSAGCCCRSGPTGAGSAPRSPWSTWPTRWPRPRSAWSCSANASRAARRECCWPWPEPWPRRAGSSC